MQDRDDEVRNWATFGLHQGEHNTPEARESLWRALDDPYPDVVGEAAAGLALFGDRTFIPKLNELLRTGEYLSPCYFEAAAEFNDPQLLGAVEFSAKRWKKTLKRGERLPSSIISAIELLRTAGNDDLATIP